MPEKMTDQRFQFLLQQFKLHSERLRDLQNQRFKITIWSTLAIFGYFGWVLTNTIEVPINLVAALPVMFGLLGFGYFFGLHKIVDRHSAFLDHLENEMLRSGAETEWEKFKSKGHHGKPLRLLFYTYWCALIIGTIFFSIWLWQAAPLSTTQEPIERDSNGESS
jgi:hypothetical protein